MALRRQRRGRCGSVRAWAALMKEIPRSSIGEMGEDRGEKYRDVKSALKFSITFDE